MLGRTYVPPLLKKECTSGFSILVMPHKPHPKKFVRDYLIRNGWYDRELQETVNVRVNRNRLAEALKRQYGNFWVCEVPGWLSRFFGEVLIDRKGNGFLQGKE